MLVYKVIKTVKGHRYAYWQWGWREGRSVRTYSLYVGPASGGWGDAPQGKRRGTPRRLPELAPQAPQRKPVITTGSFKPGLEGEDDFIAALFEPSALIGAVRWRAPWKGGRYSSKVTWTPDKRLFQIVGKLGLRGITRPWSRSLRDEDGAWINQSARLIQLPDHSRFVGHSGIAPDEAFSLTFLHELAHGTSLTERCERTLPRLSM